MTLINWFPIPPIIGGIIVYTTAKTLLFPKPQNNDLEPGTKSQEQN